MIECRESICRRFVYKSCSSLPVGAFLLRLIDLAYVYL